MDITGWTIDQKMRLPDWCFGNREVYGLFQRRNAVGFMWGICPCALPDPACIWQLVITSIPDANGKGYVRIGLADAVPTNEAEMNAAVELFPCVWDQRPGPNRIWLYAMQYVMLSFNPRKGMVTNGKKIVVELYVAVNIYMRIDVAMVVSGMPTDMAGWLEHSLI